MNTIIAELGKERRVLSRSSAQLAAAFHPRLEWVAGMGFVPKRATVEDTDEDEKFAAALECFEQELHTRPNRPGGATTNDQ